MNTRPTVRSLVPGGGRARDAVHPDELRASETAVDEDPEAGGVVPAGGVGGDRPRRPARAGPITTATRCLTSPNAAKICFQGRGGLPRVHRAPVDPEPAPPAGTTPPADPRKGSRSAPSCAERH